MMGDQIVREQVSVLFQRNRHPLIMQQLKNPQFIESFTNVLNVGQRFIEEDPKIESIAINNQKLRAANIDFGLLATGTKVLSQSLSMKDLPSIAKGTVDKVNTIIGSAVNSEAVKTGTFVTGQLLKSAEYFEVIKFTSPGKATAFVTLIMVEKVAMAAGMGNMNKCGVAAVSIGATVGLAGLTCAGTLGLGCLAGSLAVVAEVFNVIDVCGAQSENKK